MSWSVFKKWVRRLLTTVGFFYSPIKVALEIHGIYILLFFLSKILPLHAFPIFMDNSNNNKKFNSNFIWIHPSPCHFTLFSWNVFFLNKNNDRSRLVFFKLLRMGWIICWTKDEMNEIIPLSIHLIPYIGFVIFYRTISIEL